MIDLNWKMRNKLEDENFREIKDGLWLKIEGNKKYYIDFRKNDVRAYGYIDGTDESFRDKYLKRLYKFFKFESEMEQATFDKFFG